MYARLDSAADVGEFNVRFRFIVPLSLSRLDEQEKN